MNLWSQTIIHISLVYFWFVTIFEMPVIGRHTKLGHGHLLSVWKAPIGPDTLEISHDSGFHTERPETK